MDFTTYQIESQKTSVNSLDYPIALSVSGLGLAGESGEVADIIKKHVGHGHVLDEQSLKKELGDVLWYISNICTLLDISLEDIALANIEKLRNRYPNGFSTENSINRVA